MTNKIKFFVSRIKKSKDGRALVSNFSYLALLQVASYIFPLITIPYLARVIGVEGFGKIAFAAAVVVWFQTITDWGFNYTATRDVARNRDDPERISDIFSNVLWAKILLMLLSFVLLMGAIIFIPYFNENKAVLLATFLLVPGHIFSPDWFFQAMERMKYITAFNLLSKTLFTILVFVFIKEESDFIFQPFFLSLGYMVCGIFSMYIIMAKWGVRISFPKWFDIYSTIKGSTDVFVNNIMPNFYNSFSTVLLGFFGGSASTGLLDAGSRFVNIAQQFTMIFSRVFFPFLSRRSEKHSIYFRINFSIAVLFSVVLFLSAPLIISIFYTPEFHQAVIVLKVMAFSIIFLSLSNIYGVNYMIIHGHEKELKYITIISSIIGFTLSFPLVYLYDFLGAAIAVTLARGVLGLSIMIRAQAIQRRELRI